MNKIKVHKSYHKQHDIIASIINDFESCGITVLDGERNLIKRFQKNNLDINIKKFKTPNFFNSVIYKYFRKSKAERSFEYASLLISRGIKTPFPIAYYESTTILGLRESYYASEHINYDFDFRDLIHQPTFPNRENILKQFTAFTFKLHENNIEFLDHSPGNTFIKDNKDGTYDFYLIDLNRMRFKPLSLDQRLHNFRRLWLSKTMVKIIAKTYAELSSEPYDKVYDSLHRSCRKFQRIKNGKKLRKLGRYPKFKS